MTSRYLLSQFMGHLSATTMLQEIVTSLHDHEIDVTKVVQVLSLHHTHDMHAQPAMYVYYVILTFITFYIYKELPITPLRMQCFAMPYLVKQTRVRLYE